MSEPDAELLAFDLSPSEAFVTGVHWERPILVMRRGAAGAFAIGWGSLLWAAMLAMATVGVVRGPSVLTGVLVVGAGIGLVVMLLGIRMKVVAQPAAVTVQGRLRRRIVPWGQVVRVDVDAMTVRPQGSPDRRRSALVDLKLYFGTGSSVPVLRLDDGDDVCLWGLTGPSGPFGLSGPGPAPVETKAALLARYHGLVRAIAPTYVAPTEGRRPSGGAG
jgi:hypothetical protein